MRKKKVLRMGKSPTGKVWECWRLSQDRSQNSKRGAKDNYIFSQSQASRSPRMDARQRKGNSYAKPAKRVKKSCSENSEGRIRRGGPAALSSGRRRKAEKTVIFTYHREKYQKNVKEEKERGKCTRKKKKAIKGEKEKKKGEYRRQSRAK